MVDDFERSEMRYVERKKGAYVGLFTAKCLPCKSESGHDDGLVASLSVISPQTSESITCYIELLFFNTSM